MRRQPSLLLFVNTRLTATRWLRGRTGHNTRLSKINQQHDKSINNSCFVRNANIWRSHPKAALQICNEQVLIQYSPEFRCEFRKVSKVCLPSTASRSTSPLERQITVLRCVPVRRTRSQTRLSFAYASSTHGSSAMVSLVEGDCAQPQLTIAAAANKAVPFISSPSAF